MTKNEVRNKELGWDSQKWMVVFHKQKGAQVGAFLKRKRRPIRP
jgi:hypothetical protein